MRLRDLGLTVGSLHPGSANAVTDVPGVRVGHTRVQAPNVATGITAVIAYAGRPRRTPTGRFSVDGGDGMTSLSVVEDFGTAAAPVVLAPAAAVGAVYDALIEYGIAVDARLPVEAGWPPLVVPVDDTATSDPAAQHRFVQRIHLHRALAAASAEPPVEGAPAPAEGAAAPAEGAVGIGAGLAAFGCRGGVGTASRRLPLPGGGACLVGALVAANGGEPGRLSIDGYPVGAHLAVPSLPVDVPRTFAAVVVTDAPLMARQLDRLAGRAVLGLARVGLYDSGTREGLVVAQSTTGLSAPDDGEGALEPVGLLGEAHLPGLFQAAAEACEEAALNGVLGALAAGPGTRRNGHPLRLLPLERWPDMVRRFQVGGN